MREAADLPVVFEEQLHELRNLGIERSGRLSWETVTLSELSHEREMWRSAGVK